MTHLSFHVGGGGLPFYGKTKMVATFPYLSNDEMECLTGEGYGTFEALAAVTVPSFVKAIFLLILDRGANHQPRYLDQS